MGLIQSWLGYRNEFPRKLRLGVCRYFKELLTQKTALDNTAILNDLSPAFRHGACRYIQHEVHHNPLFSDIPARALAYLVPIKQLRSVAAKEHIGDVGNPGTSVYVVANGIVSLREDCDMADIRVLCAGDSFGQEALLGKERQYQYPLVAKEKVTLKVVHMLEGRAAKAKKYKMMRNSAMLPSAHGVPMNKRHSRSKSPHLPRNSKHFLHILANWRRISRPLVTRSQLCILTWHHNPLT